MQRNNGSKECAPIVCITIANQTSNRSQQYPLLWNWRTLIVKANCMFRSQLHLAQNQIFWNYNKYETEFKKKKHWNSFRYLAARHSLAWTMFLTYMIPLRSKKIMYHLLGIHSSHHLHHWPSFANNFMARYFRMPVNSAYGPTKSQFTRKLSWLSLRRNENVGLCSKMRYRFFSRLI